jgi:hypothetical protein
MMEDTLFMQGILCFWVPDLTERKKVKKIKSKILTFKKWFATIKSEAKAK